MSPPSKTTCCFLCQFILFFLTMQYFTLLVGSDGFFRIVIVLKSISGKEELPNMSTASAIYLFFTWSIERATATCNMTWKKHRFHLSLGNQIIRNSSGEVLGHAAKGIQTGDSHPLKKCKITTGWGQTSKPSTLEQSISYVHTKPTETS